MGYIIEKDVPLPTIVGADWKREFTDLQNAVAQLEVGDSIVISAKVYTRVWYSVRRFYPEMKFKLSPLEVANENGVDRRVWRIF